MQGYVYAAKRGSGRTRRSLLGFLELAGDLREQAVRLRERFEQAFWCEELSTYALALDGSKQPCRVRASNAGHCLFTGIASPERAERVARGSAGASSRFPAGACAPWRREARYNPMSYHNGSIWPHDNALIAAGLARYGIKGAAARIADRSVRRQHASSNLHRLPELFCGFHRAAGRGADAVSGGLLAAGVVGGLALSPSGILPRSVGRSPRASAVFARPFLPESIQGLRISNLRVGDALIDVSIARAGESAAVTVARKQGDIEVLLRE